MSFVEAGQVSGSGKLWLCQGVRCTGGSTRRGLTRGEESEEGGERGLLRQCASPAPPPFSMSLGGLKIDAKMVPQK